MKPCKIEILVSCELEGNIKEQEAKEIVSNEVFETLSKHLKREITGSDWKIKQHGFSVGAKG
jgi:hypothetical protein